jgi:hypothetical protein
LNGEENPIEKDYNFKERFDSLENGIYKIATTVFINAKKEIHIESNEFEIK